LNLTVDNLDLFDSILVSTRVMKKGKKQKKPNNEKMKKDTEREQMLEQVHQLELQKNYESDEKFDESTD
jgi:hypothetical protein